MGRANSGRNKLNQEKRGRLILKFLSINLIFIIILSLSMINKGNAAVRSTGNSSSVVIEQSTGKIISGYNENVKLPMASTTKILTALIAVESGRMDELVTITKESVGVEGSSIYLREGEKITLRDLVYGLMLRSGNDSASAIAIFLNGDIEKFAARMNKVAAECGAKNSHFTNPHGLHDDEHYTTAYDLALITARALDNEEFRKISSTKDHRIKSVGSEDRYIANKNKMLTSYEGAIGVKTGYTKAAGRCLVSAAERDGVTLVSVVLNVPDMWNQSMKYLDYGFDNCTKVNISAADVTLAVYKLPHTDKAMRVYMDKSLDYIITDKGAHDITYTIKLNEKIDFPIKKGEKVGKIEFFDNKRLIFAENIFTMDDIEAKGDSSLGIIANDWVKNGKINQAE